MYMICVPFLTFRKKNMPHLTLSLVNVLLFPPFCSQFLDRGQLTVSLFFLSFLLCHVSSALTL